MIPLYKYPRTHHIEGSRLQPGDEDLDDVSFGDLAGRHLVVEEKVDGAIVRLSYGARFAAARRGEHRIAVARQHPRRQFADALIVLDHENRLFQRGGACRRAGA